jgi:equilibrative nucleoside transporter 1/2/3
MLGTRSMILQAVPYFQQRFRQDSWILRYFQASNLVVFAVTILGITMVVNKLDNRSTHPNAYPRRLRAALIAYVGIATLLTVSTFSKFAVSPELYFMFLIVMVFMAATANGLSQNAAFAFVSGFGRTEYAPALMTGESLAGLLPSIIGKSRYL